MSKVTIEDVLKKYETYVSNINWHIETNEPKGHDMEICQIKKDAYEEIVSDLASLNRQGCKWTKAGEGYVPTEPDKKHWRFSHSLEPILWKQARPYAVSENNSDEVEWLSIEPCATSSENYWKQRCEAAERVIEKFVVTPLHKDVTYWGKELFKDWQELKSTPSPTGDRDCEELKKEVEYYKGKYEQSLLDINNLEEHNAELQSRINELEKFVKRVATGQMGELKGAFIIHVMNEAKQLLNKHP